ncbi:MAG: tRNA 4-thiouridine(8) synthase ThiI [Gammaproteobacteria bacterium]|nr:tRNA 4-thiouridine(8) synthase ThiI [Gammaproteobacteria bacterium]
MKYLVKYSPEMTIKSRPVRSRFAKQLKNNLVVLLGRISPEIEIIGRWDYIQINVPDSLQSELGYIEQILASTQGICFFEEVQHSKYEDLDDIFAKTLPIYRDKLDGKTFAVRCNRSGNQPFNSMDVEKFVGEGLNHNTQAAGVNLNNPDVVVKIEVRNENLFVVEKTHRGLNGFPMGSQDGVLSLISGGFDSAVSSYLSMRRGLLTHFCFFNLGGDEHEIAVKEVALYLWMRYGSTHPVRFITVPFEEVVREILEKVDNSQMGVVLKRVMLRAATRVAEKMNVEVLVTGESVAQVSSQTLRNLSVIDKVTDALVLRPLAMMEKQDIVDLARSIGTEEFSAVIPEYCGVISVNPTTRARMHKIEKQEGQLDLAVLDVAVENAVSVLIDRIDLEEERSCKEVRIVAAPEFGEVILDIRHPDEEEKRPLTLTKNVVEKIPFYKLNSAFPSLPTETDYLLYCSKGLMSKLHAAYLLEQGFDNVGVYRPGP